MLKPVLTHVWENAELILQLKQQSQVSSLNIDLDATPGRCKQADHRAKLPWNKIHRIPE